jgi:site-specific recombinase XerD
MEQGAHPKVLGDILGHRDPASISAYVRISTERLRQISLPVPS